MYVLVKHSRPLSDPPKLRIEDFKEEINSLKEAIQNGRGSTAAETGGIPGGLGGINEMTRTREAQDAWNKLYTDYFYRVYPNPYVKAFGSRAIGHIMRLSICYAALDGKPAVTLDHIRAAKAVYDYSEQGVSYLFGETNLNKHQKEILVALKIKPLSHYQITMTIYHNHSEGINNDLEGLKRLKLIKSERQATSRRPREMYYLTAKNVI